MPRRRMVPISEEIIDEAIKIGERIGVPYLVLIERILASILKIMRYKSNVLDVISALDALDDIKRLGGVMMPMPILNQLLNSFGSKDFDNLCREYVRIGTWFGELSRIKRATTVDELKRALSLWLPTSSIDVTIEGNEYKIIVSFIGHGPEVVSIAKCLFEGLIKGYNLQASEIEIKDVFIVARVKGFVEE
ncbi:MAG: hypothetical protein QXL96_11750 [Ignisphaera sp.]